MNMTRQAHPTSQPQPISLTDSEDLLDPPQQVHGGSNSLSEEEALDTLEDETSGEEETIFVTSI